MADLPAPLTPASCDLQDFPFMPLEVARLRDSELASDETPDSCWAALLLWCASWHQLPAASIPDNDQWIAKTCGYVFKGKVDKTWANVRQGAMRGWILCDDGRYYHPVVAEKARDAWSAKLRQRWGTECGRIKKHNERHPGANVHKPSFDEWMSLGCPQGQPLFVPDGSHGVSQGIPGESTSNRQGEGQGQGQGQGDSLYSAPNGAGGEPPIPTPPADSLLIPGSGERWPDDAPPAPPSPPAPPAVADPPAPKQRTAADEEKSRLWAWLKTTMVEQRTARDLKSAGIMAGGLASKYGNDVFLEACREAERINPVDAHTYVVSLCETAAGKRPGLGRSKATSHNLVDRDYEKGVSGGSLD